ncbi:MAG TPA: phage tail tube protein [Nevskia sp.]|nr:phage tail tube protein [Nevskia sp.]
MGDTTNRRGGIVNLTIDGIAYDVAGECTYDPALVTRETLKGQSGVQGYSEMPNAPHIAFKLRASGNLKLRDVNAMSNVTIVVGLATGLTVIGRNLWQVGEIGVNTQEGVTDVRFEGRDGSVIED